MLIFVIFVASPGVTKFSTNKIFTCTLVQVCEYQWSSCFVDMVASHARFDTEALHLYSIVLCIQMLTGESLATRSSLKPKFSLCVPSSKFTLRYMCEKVYHTTKFKTTKFNSERLFQIFTKISTHKNNLLYGTCLPALCTGKAHFITHVFVFSTGGEFRRV